MATELEMLPEVGDRLLRFVGDRVLLKLCWKDGTAPPEGWRACVRTNLGRGVQLRSEIIGSRFKKLPLAGASWQDIPMEVVEGAWQVDLPLAETGYFKAKAYAVDPEGRQHWPDGPDTGIAVHPDSYRTANTIYCAFPRMFGPTRQAHSTTDRAREGRFHELDQQGYTVIPPSGKLRDVVRELPHIIDGLGCRILHLLPVSPTPTTLARFGRFGSPYACLDLTAIDPSLVEFDKRTTGVDQLRELTEAVHARGGRVFLDLVINHTGWGSTVFENHPEWFARKENGEFLSPGAWGNTWEDLVELDQRHPPLWEHLAEVFLVWCRRGIDGFRCDAGYQVPMHVWQFITAKVREEFPDTLFLLEGLGGGWDDTASLLTEGGMQWAYSELFQEYTGKQVAGYLDHAFKQSGKVGALIHYSETHDNKRLAARGRAWSLLRNRLCALTSVSGGFGFTCGVEWLAAEKVEVHDNRGLAWGHHDNIVGELAALNRLISNHPCFFDGARLTRLSGSDSLVYALLRQSADGGDEVLVLANTDPENGQAVDVELPGWPGEQWHELTGQPLPGAENTGHGKWRFHLPPGACVCVSAEASPRGLAGDDYRRLRGLAAWGVQVLAQRVPLAGIGPFDWREVAAKTAESPERFLASVSRLDAGGLNGDGMQRALEGLSSDRYSPVIVWNPGDRGRTTTIPPAHWLLIKNHHPFRARLVRENHAAEFVESIQANGEWMACMKLKQAPGDAVLRIERYSGGIEHLEAPVRFLEPGPRVIDEFAPHRQSSFRPEDSMVLLTNGRGGMARLCVDLGNIRSKYDCALGANLHASLPVDRHVFVKRVRLWVVADGFITPLNGANLCRFAPGPPAVWEFTANAGDGRSVAFSLSADMIQGENTTRLVLHRPEASPPVGNDLPEWCDVRLTVRIDIEDRNFHTQTKCNEEVEDHFASHCRPLEKAEGFVFQPAKGRKLEVVAGSGCYRREEEWSLNVAHPVESTRGQEGAGDAWSPGWFDIPLGKGESSELLLTAEARRPASAKSTTPKGRPDAAKKTTAADKARTGPADFGARLEVAARQFVVRRDDGKTVIAGYPWFLDWGRDTLIAARGLLAAGMLREVQDLLMVFGRFEEEGTLPNTIHGSDASNRDTSDAPLWYGIVCEELAERMPPNKGDSAGGIYAQKVHRKGRTLRDVLCSIAEWYRRGTPNGIHMDPASGLIWSPGHFTWMDTNFPAGTPREGYPVEIQVMWIRLLMQLEGLGADSSGEAWGDLAHRARESFERLFWIEERGWLADVLQGHAGRPANDCVPDQALRSNCLFAISLGLLGGVRAKRCVEAAQRHLVVPGALRSLAPLPVEPPLPVIAQNGQLLNDPHFPYWGTYEGDEDTCRKPAYHNGTAWTWPFPSFCEALVRAYEFEAASLAASRAWLGSMDRLLNEGCLGQIPEVLDGDAPHAQRGCDAQAWGVTEALRVWRWLEGLENRSNPPGREPGSPSG